MRIFECPYFKEFVELSEEREEHIIERHPGTLPEYEEQLAQTLLEPDWIRASARDPSTFLFSRWFEEIRTGRFLIVAIVRDESPQRLWIVTMYTARKISGGNTLWTKG